MTLPLLGAERVYDEAGGGAPLMFVHGTGADASTGDGVVPSASQLAHLDTPEAFVNAVLAALTTPG